MNAQVASTDLRRPNNARLTQKAARKIRGRHPTNDPIATRFMCCNTFRNTLFSVKIINKRHSPNKKEQKTRDRLPSKKRVSQHVSQSPNQFGASHRSDPNICTIAIYELDSFKTLPSRLYQNCRNSCCAADCSLPRLGGFAGQTNQSWIYRHWHPESRTSGELPENARPGPGGGSL